MAASARSKGKHHFQPARLRSALGGVGLTRDDQRLLLEHFSAGCPTCRQRFEALVEGLMDGAPPLPEPREVVDPVSRAFYRLVCTHPDLPGARHALDLLEPIHRLAVVQAHDHPRGFARLMLEEARKEAFENEHRDMTSTVQASSLLRVARLKLINPRRRRDLTAVALSYEALGQFRLGNRREAGWLLYQAEAMREAGSGDPEVYAVVAEALSHLLADEGRYREALGLLEEAQRRMAKLDLPGRQAELLGHYGLLRHVLGEEGRALAALEQARDLLPSDQSPGVRVYLLLDLAIVEIDLGRVAEARRYFEEATPLYVAHGDARLTHLRHWVSGRIERETGHFEEAIRDLRLAIDGFIAAGAPRKALRALADLAITYYRSGNRAGLREVRAYVETLTKDPEIQAMIREVDQELFAKTRCREQPSEPAESERWDVN